MHAEVATYNVSSIGELCDDFEGRSSETESERDDDSRNHC